MGLIEQRVCPAGPLRLMVLDGSRVLPALVRRLVPPDIAVESVETFDQARRVLRELPPQALIINLGPSDLPWAELQALCRDHSPPLPVLYESCVHRSPDEAGLHGMNGCSTFLVKPYTLDELRRSIDWLVGVARAGDGVPSPAD